MMANTAASGAYTLRDVPVGTYGCFTTGIADGQQYQQIQVLPAQQTQRDAVDRRHRLQPLAVGVPNEGVGRIEIVRHAGGGREAFERVGDAVEEGPQIGVGFGLHPRTLTQPLRARKRANCPRIALSEGIAYQCARSPVSAAFAA